MSIMEGSSVAQRPQIICIEVPGPKESPSPSLFTTPCICQLLKTTHVQALLDVYN